MSFEFRHLQAFVTVVDQGGFTRAGEHLGLSQPTVSEQVASLERACGARLLDRLGRSVKTTPAGEALLGHAQGLLERRQRALEAMATISGLKKGSVTIRASTVPGEFLLPRHLVPFQATFPGIDVTVEIGDSADVLTAVSEGTVDFGVLGLDTGASLAFEPLWRDELVLAVPAGHSLAHAERAEIADVLGEAFILREEGSGTLRLFTQGLVGAGRALSELEVVVRLGSTAAVKEAVMAGLGVSVISSLALQREVDHGLLATLTLTDLDLARQFHLAFDPRRSLSSAAKATMDYLRHQAAP